MCATLVTAVGSSVRALVRAEGFFQERAITRGLDQAAEQFGIVGGFLRLSQQPDHRPFGRMHRGSILGSYQEVETLGERAFLFGKESGRPVLCAFRSPYYLQISTPGLKDGNQGRAALETLARAALRRLTPGVTLRAGAAQRYQFSAGVLERLSINRKGASTLPADRLRP